MKIFCNIGNILPKTAKPTDNALIYGCDACEFMQDNELHRCSKFIAIAGKTPDGKDVDEWRCSDSWLPVLILENAMTNRGQTAAIESMRNEAVKSSNEFNAFLYQAIEQKKLNG